MRLLPAQRGGHFIIWIVSPTSHQSLTPPPLAPPAPPLVFSTPRPRLLFFFFHFIIFFVHFLSLSFSLNLQDVSKYHAGLQTGRWQTIKGRCRLIISSALWLTSISPRSHWAAAGRGENMQSGGLHSSQIYCWLFRPGTQDGRGEQLYVTQNDLKFNWADFILFAVGVRAEIRAKGQYCKTDSSLSTARELSEKMNESNMYTIWIGISSNLG